MSDVTNSKPEKSTEVKLFLVLTVFLAPALAIVVVGTLGLGIWIYQIIAGPPGF